MWPPRVSNYPISRYKGYLEVVDIVMNNATGCETYPSMDMDESCESPLLILTMTPFCPDEVHINTTGGSSRIISATVWGILRWLLMLFL